MAHFYAWMQGARGAASRLGTKKSGLRTDAKSWEGAVQTDLWYNETFGCDFATVRLIKHNNRGTEKLLYCGPVSGRGADVDLNFQAAE